MKWSPANVCLGIDKSLAVLQQQPRTLHRVELRCQMQRRCPREVLNVDVCTAIDQNFRATSIRKLCGVVKWRSPIFVTPHVNIDLVGLDQDLGHVVVLVPGRVVQKGLVVEIHGVGQPPPMLRYTNHSYYYWSKTLDRLTNTKHNIFNSKTVWRIGNHQV